MSIATTVTRGYGSFGSIADIVLRGYASSAVVTYPEGTLVSRGYGNPTTISDIVLRNYTIGAAVARDRSPDAIYAKQKRRYYKQLQDELDRQIALEQEAAEKVAPTTKRGRKKAKRAPTQQPIIIPDMASVREITAVLDRIISGEARQTVVAKERARWVAVNRRDRLNAEIEQAARQMAIRAIQDDEDAIMALLMA